MYHSRTDTHVDIMYRKGKETHQIYNFMPPTRPICYSASYVTNISPTKESDALCFTQVILETIASFQRDVHVLVLPDIHLDILTVFHARN